MNNIISILLSIGLFAIILVIVVIIIIKKSSKPKKVKTFQKVEEKEIVKLEDLMKVVKNRDSSVSELKKALIDFNDNFVITEDNLTDSLIFLTYLLRHQNRNKELFDILHKEVKVNNKKFADEIGKVEMKCL